MIKLSIVLYICSLMIFASINEVISSPNSVITKYKKYDNKVSDTLEIDSKIEGYIDIDFDSEKDLLVNIYNDNDSNDMANASSLKKPGKAGDNISDSDVPETVNIKNKYDFEIDDQSDEDYIDLKVNNDLLKKLRNYNETYKVEMKGTIIFVIAASFLIIVFTIIW